MRDGEGKRDGGGERTREGEGEALDCARPVRKRDSGTSRLDNWYRT